MEHKSWTGGKKIPKHVFDEGFGRYWIVILALCVSAVFETLFSMVAIDPGTLLVELQLL